MKVFINSVLAVGMPHYGKDSLVVGAKYQLCRDRRNSRDCNAVAVVDEDGHQEGKLEDGTQQKVFSKIFDHKHLSINRDVGILLKPKAPKFYHSPRFGVAQKCSVGLFCKAKDEDELRKILAGSGLSYRFG